ncbi:MAG TPA: amidohydrolase [Candidatus Bathyarchaeia archaeon]|nr:amidohydrolase [Candidatus Bathyarchaeia archaeon]
MKSSDVIFYNGRIHFDPSRRSTVQALAISEGNVSEVGSSKRIMRLKNRNTKLINLRNRSVLPGLADSHIHLLGYAMRIQTLDLSNARSISAIQRVVARAGSERSRSAWILGRGWDQEKLREKRFPTKRDLDVVSNPVFLKRICGHVGVANSKALENAVVTDRTLDPEGGVIVRESGTREPNGVLEEGAMSLVDATVPRTSEDVRPLLIAASKKLLQMGLTFLHCIIQDLEELAIIRELKENGGILQSINAIIPSRFADRLTRSDANSEAPGNSMRIRAVKVYLDGSLGARTAALSEPYDDDPRNSGMLTTSREELTELAEVAKQENFQLCIHAIGDRAVRVAVEVLSHVFAATTCRRMRHRIEHASVIPSGFIVKMRKLGIVASVQPRFIYSDSWASERLGKTRLRGLYPFRSLIEEGVHVAAGSDAPVEDPNPFEGIWSAIARPGLAGNEKLTVGQAIGTYTTGAAFSSFSEGFRGTLRPGRSAEMVVLSSDPFESQTNDLRKIRVFNAIVDGEFT